MMRIRLIPVLLFGLVSLFGLKVIGLTTDAGAPARMAVVEPFSLGERMARGATSVRLGPHDDTMITGSVPKKEPEDKKVGSKAKEGDDGSKPKITPEPEGVRVVIPPQPNQAASAAERNLLEKLKERRENIESRNKELEMRDSLLRATEQKLDERVGILRSLENATEAAGGREDVKNRYKSLVIMYENMKPKDAARVFDKLDVKELIELVRHINPRKMSEVLAVMDPAAAVKLTVAMAREANNPMSKAPASETPTQSVSSDLELPRLAPQPRQTPPNANGAARAP